MHGEIIVIQNKHKFDWSRLTREGGEKFVMPEGYEHRLFLISQLSTYQHSFSTMRQGLHNYATFSRIVYHEGEKEILLLICNTSGYPARLAVLSD